MKFINKHYIVFWAAILLVSVLILSSYLIRCWDGVQVDKERLMRDCGVSPEEYREKVQADSSFCPAGEESFVPVGGCGPDWKTVIENLVILSIIYNLFYSIFYLFMRKKK